jgi:hypothetical protein
MNPNPLSPHILSENLNTNEYKIIVLPFVNTLMSLLVPPEEGIS